MIHACYVSADCRTRLVKSTFLMTQFFKGMSSSTVPKGHFISYLTTIKLVFKWFIYHLVRVNDSSVEIPPIQLDPIVSEFPKVFPYDLHGVPLER